MYGTGIQDVAIIMTIDGDDPIVFEKSAVAFFAVTKNRRALYDKLQADSSS